MKFREKSAARTSNRKLTTIAMISSNRTLFRGRKIRNESHPSWLTYCRLLTLRGRGILSCIFSSLTTSSSSSSSSHYYAKEYRRRPYPRGLTFAETEVKSVPDKEGVCKSPIADQSISTYNIPNQKTFNITKFGATTPEHNRKHKFVSNVPSPLFSLR